MIEQLGGGLGVVGLAGLFALWFAWAIFGWVPVAGEVMRGAAVLVIVLLLLRLLSMVWAYVRLHGRNVKQWWHHEHRDDRYTSLYSTGELQEFAEDAGAAKELVRKSYLYMNNHFAAKSVVNAVMLKAQLGEPIEGEYPPELVERYPEIKDLVSISPAMQPSRLLS